MSKNYIVTGFNEKYWRSFGASWLASLLEFSGHPANQTFIVGYNLSENTKTIIKNNHVNLIENTNRDNFRNNTLKTISNLAHDYSGKFAYWDADVFFHAKTEELFDIMEDKILISSNNNPGFMAGNSANWKFIQSPLDVMNFFDDKELLYNRLVEYYKPFIFRVPNVWNCTDLTKLEYADSNFMLSNKIQKVIHVTGHLKSVLNNRKIYFWERYPELFGKYSVRIKPKKMVFSTIIKNNS